MQLFGKTFKVHYIDANTRIFIDKLSALNAQYRTIGMEYDSVVKLLRQHFTEKKAMQALYKLEQATISLVKVKLSPLPTTLTPTGAKQTENSLLRI